MRSGNFHVDTHGRTWKAHGTNLGGGTGSVSPLVVP
jgi:hypothetical protein